MIIDFFREIYQEKIDCVVLKSFEDIDKLFTNESVELDLYVPLEQRDLFKKLAVGYGFYLRTPIIPRYTEFYYILEDNRIIMLHIAYKIITGGKFKNIPLFTEERLGKSQRSYRGIKISDTRSYLCYHTVKYLLLGYQKHWEVIQNASSEQIAYIDKKYKNHFDLQFGLLSTALHTKNEEDKYKEVRKKFIKSIRQIYWYLAFRHTLDRILTRVKWISKNSSFDIAFIGVDGSGKSTLSRLIQKQLSFIGAKNVTYLGPTKTNKIISFFDRFKRVLFGKIACRIGKITIYDRYLYDMVAYREGNLITKILLLLTPDPQFTFYCTSDSDIIISRKSHDDINELIRVDQQFNKLSSDSDSIIKIDTRESTRYTLPLIMNTLEKAILKKIISWSVIP